MRRSKNLNFSRYTKVWARPFFVTALFIMLFFLQTSCQTETKKSVLILAFDQLDNEQLNCSDELHEDNSGFTIICKEFMRFTHAYTPSLQPAAAIGSILSGQYPLGHGLHRSFDSLNSNIVTVQELAYKKGYRTGFFAGNPHILKKTGLSKYFETFDDSAASQYSNQIIKDFKLTSENFLDWQKEENSPFFALITNSEIEALNEQDTATTNFEKLDEKLFNFISELKQRGIWENAYIYVVGLKGLNNYNRLNETPFLNLHSENTLVSLLIKPPRMQGDEGISWKNDTPVSLADIGYTLKTFFDRAEDSILPNFPLINLNQFYTYSQDKQIIIRKVLIEAANPWLKSPLQLNFGLITPTHLLIDRKDEPEVFNLVTDRFEVVNLYKKSSHDSDVLLLQNLYKNRIDLSQDNGISSARDYLKSALPNNLLSSVSINEYHPLFLYWLNQRLKNNEKVELSKLNQPYNPCLRLVEKAPKSIFDLKSCPDGLFVDYLKYKYANVFDLNAEKSKLTYELSRKKYFEETKIAIWNLALENIWGLYSPYRIWYHPLITIESNFVLN